MDLETKIGQFVRIRDAKAAAKKEFDAATARLNQALEKLEAEILAALQGQGVTNVKSPSGTAYMSTKAAATVKDQDLFVQWCRENDQEGAMDIRANKVAIRELLDAGVTPPGVNYSERVTLGVRRT